jgi:HEAT repeat protein
VAGIVGALEAADDEAASALASALVRLRRRDATAALFEVMRKPNVAARKAVAGALGGLGGKEATAALRTAADEDPEPEVRQICSLLLAR